MAVSRNTSIILTDLTQEELAFLTEWERKTQSEIIRVAVTQMYRKARHEQAKQQAEIDRIRNAS